MNIKQIAEISQGTWPTVSSSVRHLLITATADASLGLPDSLS